MTVRFISDCHFHHANIIRYDGRPFQPDNMDDAMIALWNETVSVDDLTYILGDISWASPERTAQIFRELHGEKILIRGNHDTDKLLYNNGVSRCFKKIENYMDIRLGNKYKHVVLCHYPIMFFDHARYGAVHLYGHVHNSYDWKVTDAMQKSLAKDYGRWRMYNVGCMMPYMNYVPRTIDEILAACEQTSVSDKEQNNAE